MSPIVSPILFDQFVKWGHLYQVGYHTTRPAKQAGKMGQMGLMGGMGYLSKQKKMAL